MVVKIPLKYNILLITWGEFGGKNNSCSNPFFIVYFITYERYISTKKEEKKENPRIFI